MVKAEKKTKKTRNTCADSVVEKSTSKVKKLKSIKKASKNKDGKEQSKKTLKTTTKKPSKASKSELKEVIVGLKKDPTLILTRKALRFIPSFLKSTGLTKKLIRQVIKLWAGSHEKIRVISLLCVIRIYTKTTAPIKEMITKMMYASYMSSTNNQTLALMVFMRQSLVEIYSLDKVLAYKQGFTYCKELASTLKGAYEAGSHKTVYNRQYVNCLTLWSDLLASQMPNKHIEQLLNPVVQLHMGAINLISSPRYYPFYLHLIGNLVNLSVSLDAFIPVLPLMTSILDRLKFSQKTSKTESYNFDILIEVPESETQCRLYVETTIDRLHELMVKYLSSQWHKISFPELCLIPKLQVRKFVKQNKKESDKFRSLLAMMEEKIKFIEDRRQTVDFAFTDFSAIDAWEKSIKDSGQHK